MKNLFALSLLIFLCSCIADYETDATDPLVQETSTDSPVPSSKKTFVTTLRYSGSLGGVSGADSKCMSDAPISQALSNNSSIC